MPIYEYQCDCGNKEEKFLSFKEYGQPQVCECGKDMYTKISLSSFVMKQTGKDMALATLNAPKGKGMPNRHWKPNAERKANAGLERPAKTVW